MVATRLYLDVDGVLNAPLAGRAWPTVSTAPVDLSFAGFDRPVPVSWSPDLVAALDRVRHDFDVELVWLTTWCEQDAVVRLLVPLFRGLAGGRVAPFPGLDDDAPFGWKAATILREHAASALPFVWVDDLEVSAHGRQVRLATADTPTLLIGPRSQDGLRPTHVRRMRGFLEGVQRTARAR